LNRLVRLRNPMRISPHGLHWEALDDDVSIAGLLAGQSELSGDHTVAA